MKVQIPKSLYRKRSRNNSNFNMFLFKHFGSDFQVKIAKAKCEKLKTPQKLLSYQHIEVHPTNHITNSCDQTRQKVKRPLVFSTFLIFKMWIPAIFFYKRSFELNDVERLSRYFSLVTFLSQKH